MFYGDMFYWSWDGQDVFFSQEGSGQVGGVYVWILLCEVFWFDRVCLVFVGGGFRSGIDFIWCLLVLFFQYELIWGFFVFGILFRRGQGWGI